MTEVDTALSLEIPSMLLGMWNSPTHGQYDPEFRQDAHVVEGVLNYEIPKEWLSLRELEVMSDA